MNNGVVVEGLGVKGIEFKDEGSEFMVHDHGAWFRDKTGNGSGFTAQGQEFIVQGS